VRTSQNDFKVVGVVDALLAGVDDERGQLIDLSLPQPAAGHCH